VTKTFSMGCMVNNGKEIPEDRLKISKEFSKG
jgi:hypothetical protein